MALYASKILKLVVDEFRDTSVSEVQFVSGMKPAFVTKLGPQSLDYGNLSSERVGQIHELCRLVADDPVVETENMSTYTFVLLHFGRVLCKFQRKGSSSSLIMKRDSHACETIAAIRPKPLPSLCAEATPEWKEQEH